MGTVRRISGVDVNQKIKQFMFLIIVAALGMLISSAFFAHPMNKSGKKTGVETNHTQSNKMKTIEASL